MLCAALPDKADLAKRLQNLPVSEALEHNELFNCAVAQATACRLTGRNRQMVMRPFMKQKARGCLSLEQKRFTYECL